MAYRPKIKICWLLIAAGLAFQTSLTTAAANCSDFIYSSTKNGETRWTVLRDGDFLLQGIFSQSVGKKCKTAGREGNVNVLVMQHAIQNIAKSNILPGYSLGYQFDDGCEDIPKVMERGIEIVSLYRPNSVCRADYLTCNNSSRSPKVKPVSAVIGPGYSFLAIPLASLMGLYSIPHISYQASSRLLSKSNLYKSFLRTIPPDTNQVAVMIDMMKRFDWNYLFAVGSDDNYGKLAISSLKELAQKNNICVAHDEYIPTSNSKKLPRVIEIVKKIKATPKASLVVLFTYSSMGELILNEAEKNGIQRIWLTSDAWSARGAVLNVSRKYLTGILTVATEKTVIPGLDTFLKDKIKNSALCIPWLELYLKQNFNCKRTSNGLSLDCPGETIDSIASRMLKDNSGGYGNLYDAVYAVTYAIEAMLKKKCNYKSSSYNKSRCFPMDPKELLAHMFNVSFTGIFNRTVSFDTYGDPKFPHYIIENIKDINGRLRYVQVGTWHKHDNFSDLVIDNAKISWPYPFTKTPSSKCSRDCLPGEYVHAKTECCFSCQECKAFHVSNSINAAACTACPKGYHTDKQQTKCIKTPIIYLTSDNPGGAAILSMSIIGLICALVLLIVFIKVRKLSVIQESQTVMIFLSIILLFPAFAYGILHLFKPTDTFCSARSSYFFLLFVIFSGLLLTNTIFVKVTVTSAINNLIKVNTSFVQYAILIILAIIEMATIIVWLYIDPVRLGYFPDSDNTKIFLECKVDMTQSRLICMCLPCLVLALAAIISFRERNHEHPFNEPKFLSFTTLALVIVVVAFIPTFKFVVGIYKAIVMAFTVDVWAYTYIGCIFVPKLYAAALQRFHHIDSQIQEVQLGAHDFGSPIDDVPTSSRIGTKEERSTHEAKYICAGPSNQDVHLLKKVSLTGSLPPSPVADDFLEQKSDTDSAKNIVIYRI